jgi:hypothetical protein
MRRRTSFGLSARRRRGRCASVIEALALGQYDDFETFLRHVDPTIGMLYHPRVPSLLMRARALATVREWKKRLEHQAHSGRCHRGGYGFPAATGAVS